MMRLFGASRRSHDEDGASAVEYGLLVAAIAGVIVIIVFALGGIVSDLFTSTCNEIDNKATTTTTCAN